MFQHTAARRRLATSPPLIKRPLYVSTHSRPKAAGGSCWCASMGGCCFNTQPPEGGWSDCTGGFSREMTFQHTAARRRLAAVMHRLKLARIVSTHSRPKAAGVCSQNHGT